MIPPGPASHTHDTNDRQRDREIRLVQARDEAWKAASRWQDVAERYLAELNTIAALHQPDEMGQACDNDGLTWPCETRRVIDGGTT